MQMYNKENASPPISNAFERERIEGKMEGKLEGKAEGEAEGKAEGKIEGKIEGKAEERRKIALNLLKQELSVELVVSATGLSLEEVQDLQG